MSRIFKKIPLNYYHGFYEFDFESGNHYLNRNDIINSIEKNQTKVYLLGVDEIPDDIDDIRHLIIDDFALHIYAYKINSITCYFSILPICFNDADLIKYAIQNTCI